MAALTAENERMKRRSNAFSNVIDSFTQKKKNIASRISCSQTANIFD